MQLSPSGIRISHSFLEFSEIEWDSLVPSDTVFQEHAFLKALEDAGCIGNRDWRPFIFSYNKGGKLLGLCVAYLRNNSYGEYIFDFQWAEAFVRAGIPYYPKFTIASPFTPVSGQRILLHPDLNEDQKKEVQRQLLVAVLETARETKASSVHTLYCKPEERQCMEDLGFIPRISHQYHWWNKSFSSFEEFLATLIKDRRKTIKQERRKIKESGLVLQRILGEEITDEHCKIFYSFYQDTHTKKWGQAYLNFSFFEKVFKSMKHRLLLVLASKPTGEPVGGSMNFYKDQLVLGRYWGALEHVPNLHFECCYYQLIEFAIERGLTRVEAGAQGEHKFLRGYTAEPQYSMHYIFHPEGRKAIERYLLSEREMESENIMTYNQNSPIKALRESE